MKHVMPAAKSLVIGAVAVGALTLGSAGLAGAATTPAPSTATHQFNCANATRALTRIQKVETRIADGLPKLTAAEAKATAAGNTQRAARLQRRITRLESTTFKNRLDALSSKIEAKCDVAAPSA